MFEVAERLTVPEVTVRWMIRGDCQRVGDISKSSLVYRPVLTAREAVIALKQKTVVGAVAELHYDQHHSQIAGFIFVSTASEQQVEIIVAAVDERWQRSGIGDMLLEHVERISRHIGYGIFVACCHEREYGAQKWLQKNGYLCQQVAKNWHESEDGYVFKKVAR